MYMSCVCVYVPVCKPLPAVVTFLLILRGTPIYLKFMLDRIIVASPEAED